MNRGRRISRKIVGCGNYVFSSFRDDVTAIGNAQVKKKEGYDYSLDPYFLRVSCRGWHFQFRPIGGR